jgi:serine/threonine-protein kinase
VLGTPHYLSPEAVTDQARVGPASDLYSLGAVAYFLLTAAPPFDAPTLVELCSRHVHSIPAPPSDHAAVPSELDRMVLGLLAKHPEDRPATARVVADGLEQMTSPPWTTGDMEAWWKANGATARHDTRANIEPASGALLEVDVFRPSR